MDNPRCPFYRPRMKSHIQAGNFNLKGKKSKLLLCRCCTVDDLRDKNRCKEAAKEMKDGYDQV